MNESQKRCSEFIIARSDPAKDLELIEKALDQMPFFIGMIIAKPRFDHITLWWDRIRCTLFGDICANGLCSIGFISQNIAAADPHLRKQINGCTCVKDISACEQKMNRVAQGIHNSMNFCGLSTVTYANKLIVFRIYSPLFAPALCGCALMDVLSMHRFSKSASAFSS